MNKSENTNERILLNYQILDKNKCLKFLKKKMQLQTSKVRELRNEKIDE